MDDVDFSIVKPENCMFDFESELRDELYNIGKFEDILITDKEKIYNFGRIDLFGIDINNNICCIEVKKNKSFDDTVDQLLKYKNSKCFNRIIYCCYQINEVLLQWCKNNDIETYTYTRTLKVCKI